MRQRSPPVLAELGKSSSLRLRIQLAQAFWSSLHRLSRIWSCPLFYSGHVSASDPSCPKTVINYITRAVALDEAVKKPSFRSEGSLRLLGQRPPDPMAGAFEAGRGRDQAPYPLLQGFAVCP